jgi:hypothetical protein
MTVKTTGGLVSRAKRLGVPQARNLAYAESDHFSTGRTNWGWEVAYPTGWVAYVALFTEDEQRQDGHVADMQTLNVRAIRKSVQSYGGRWPAGDLYGDVWFVDPLTREEV